MQRQGYSPDKQNNKRSSPVGTHAGHKPANVSGRRAAPAASRENAAQRGYPAPGAAPQTMRHEPVPGPARDTRRNEPPRPKKKRSILSIITLILLFAGGLSAALYYHFVNSQVIPYDNLFCQGVFIDGIPMGGLTAEEGTRAVQEHINSFQSSWYIRLMYREQIVATLTGDMLGMVVKTHDVLEEAWRLGRSGDIFERKAARDALLTDNCHFFTAFPNPANLSIIDDILLNIKTEVYREATDAKLVGFDPLADSPFTYQQETAGRMLDIITLKESILEKVYLMETAEFEIVPSPIWPAVTVDDLKALTTLRGESITEIARASTENRTNNIRVAFDRINGKQLKPGERFSFNGVVGVRDSKNFFEAIEYANGTEQMGYGGGVCQASTTIYLAALKAGLEITKRLPHSDSVSYTPYGQDATVSSVKGHEIDFSFRNNTDGTIYICSAVRPDPKNKNRYICRVRIYGPDMGGITYKIESVTVQKLSIPATPIYDKDTDQAFVIYTDETKLKTKGKEGYVVETYLVTILQNQETHRKLISTDKYPAKPDRYWVGTRKR